MPRYRIWDCTLDADIDFPELPRSDSAGQQQVLLRRSDWLLSERGARYNTWSNSAGDVVDFEHLSPHYLIRVFNRITFLIHSDLETVEYAYQPTVESDEFRHQCLNLLMPVLWGGR